VNKNNVVVYSQPNIEDINNLIGTEVRIEHSPPIHIENDAIIPTHYSIYVGDSGGHFIGYCESGINLKNQIASTGASSYRLLMEIEGKDVVESFVRELRRILPGKPHPKHVLTDNIRSRNYSLHPSSLLSKIESMRDEKFPKLHTAIWGSQNKLLHPLIFRSDTPLAGSRVWLKKNMPISMSVILWGVLGGYALTNKGLVPLSGFEFVRNNL
jgi:hypothetical protein